MYQNSIRVRLILALLIAAGSYFSYLMKSQVNPVTGEKQHISLTAEQEIALGLQSAPEMINQMGGESQNAQLVAYVTAIGNKLVQSTEARTAPYRFQFHVLADPQTINAFALPGGQVFITEGLIARLTRDNPKQFEAEIAGVLGHEIGHVIGRHSAEHMAKQGMLQGLVSAGSIAMSDGSGAGSQLAGFVGNMINLKYGRNDELEADHFGVKYTCETGYDPHAMINVMEILKQASGGQRQSEFMSTHPAPENRIVKIKEAIKETQCE